MSERFRYRLNDEQKNRIAFNLIEVLQSDAFIFMETKKFVSEWILTDWSGKRKAFFDVWDLVLKNYMPVSRPILFRANGRFCKNGKIASFTGSIESATRFSCGKGRLLICDTRQSLEHESFLYRPGEYRNTFYPLVDLLGKAIDEKGHKFHDEFWSGYKGEDEYIMRVNLNSMHCLRWSK